MRTKASIKGHPIHPMLIPFPIAFLTGAFIADFIGWAIDAEEAWRIGAYLALGGIITGLAAGVPGFIDYVWTVPPRSSGKKRATYHMIVNVGAIALFAVAWILRGEVSARPGPAMLILEAAGVILLTMGGWLGGTLVNRNFIGPEHRYANGGKWSELTIDTGDVKSNSCAAEARGSPQSAQPALSRVRVADTDELEVNQMKLIHIGERRIVIARTDDGYAAFDDRCTHRGGSLAGGVMICGTVQCLWHGSQFDAHTGKPKAGPAEKGIGTYDVEVNDGAVWVHLDGK